MKFLQEEEATMNTKLYANRSAGTPTSDPFEVVEVRTAKKMMIRRDGRQARSGHGSATFTPGGFFGHTANDRDQRWFITPDPVAPVFAIRQRKNGKWYNTHDNRYAVGDTPRKFYDHNF